MGLKAASPSAERARPHPGAVREVIGFNAPQGATTRAIDAYGMRDLLYTVGTERTGALVSPS
ncbi:hypothetical protein ACFWWM_12290 [Streptomyces sp. NPDC058682]|uniref:hypothetical protein n=1 Tax=unclassified Streptomyces TaxID=2593676 RepID=UPI002255AD09|nr:hypothetical protein [Streptomyces sp. NBC_01214]MCX4807688.1 hypothetical protein [Streptomyces sp. NBC_01214]